MKYRPTVVCEGDFSNDALWEDDELRRPSGLNVSLAIREMLISVGMDVSDPEPDLQHEYWELRTAWDGRNFSVKVYSVGEVIITSRFYGYSSFLSMFSRDNLFKEFLVKFHELLSRNERFGVLKWYEVYDAAHDSAPLPV